MLWGLFDHPSRNVEDIGAEDDLNCTDLAQEILMVKKVSMWPRDCFCDILVKNMATFAIVQRVSWKLKWGDLN